MIESAAIQAVFKLVLLTLVFIGAPIALRLQDRAIEKMEDAGSSTNNSRFAKWFRNAGKLEKGIYYAARIAAIYIAAGLVIG